MPLLPSLRRLARGTLGVGVALVAAGSNQFAGAQAVPAAAPGFGALQGFVMDSIHNVPLANATVRVEGTPRTAVTDKDGNYRIDSIPLGQHRVVVLHPLFDTVGVTMRTPA